MSEQRGFSDLGVLVGIDGSKASLQAVDWAARAAVDTRRPLTLSLVLPSEATFAVPVQPAITTELCQRGEHLLSRAVERATATAPSVQTQTRLGFGHAAAELRHLATGADMLVLGSHGAGWFNRLVIGSTTTQLATHAPGIVVVTRMDPPRGSAPVVVGVDGSDSSDRALEFGFATAARAGCGLHAIHTYAVPPIFPANGMAVAREPALASRLSATSLLDDTLAPWAAKYPDVDVRREIVRGPAGRVLVEASLNASLVVVGSRGRGGFTGLLLGSVSQHVLALASCPVAVAH